MTNMLAHAEGADHPVALDGLKRVVLVLSSSRGGSSWLSNVLKRSRRFWHVDGEINPELRLAGLMYPQSKSGSDALDACTSTQRLAVARFLSPRIGEPTRAKLQPWEWDEFASVLSARLAWQWPALQIGLPQVHEALTEARRAVGDPDFGAGSVDEFLVSVLVVLVKRFPEIEPHYYDLPSDLLQRAFQNRRPPHAPPSGGFLEEPPFVFPVPWRGAGVPDAASRPLILKTPSNAYRLPFLLSLFRQASVRILHLTRNPAAAVNGLIDGWRHHGFHSHRMTQGLRIRGYSDRVPECGEHWWKFDLPPGWESYTSRTLEEVCAFQWRSAHAHILNEVKRLNLNSRAYCRVRYEDLVADDTERGPGWKHLLDWLDVAEGPERDILTARDSRLVMATHRPARGRWRERSSTILPNVTDSHTLDLAEELGYARDQQDWH